MPQHELATLTDLPEGAPVKAEAGDTAILLIRDGDAVSALTHECPHLGLPLSKGVVRDGTLICPFHHACFDARTGRQTEPPGYGDLHRFDVEIRNGRVFVDVPAEIEAHPAPPFARQGADPRRVVIAGAGAAAEECALTLRAQGFEGQIEMIAPDGQPPYDRTMLTKAVLTGDAAPTDLTLTDSAALAARDIALIDGRVTAIEPGQVILADGGRHAFDGLLLAPGGTPRRLDLPGHDLAGIHVLRSVAQAQALLPDLQNAARVGIVGGGFIGMEAALSLTKRGLDVTVIFPEDVPLAAPLGHRVGAAIMAEHQDAGVTIRPTTKITGFSGTDRVTAITTDQGEIAVDLVLIAIGVTPATADIDGIAVGDDGGVTVAPDLTMPGHENIWVAGDCAHVPTPFGSARIEHWRVARQHGRRAALAMLGQPPDAPDIPFFWTALARQYRYLGHAADWDEIAFDGTPEDGPFLARYLKDGQVMAVLGAGRDAELADLHAQMRAVGGPLPA
ncbi:MAG: FAD-dependent oxidoreductase [Pseudomonadota bacterium]